jgi:hypothetical protein
MADLGRERVTALWREAVAALETPITTEVERDVVAVRGRLDYPRRAKFPYLAALEALDRLARDAAEYGRLREQLAVTRQDSGNLIAAAVWWRDYATNRRLPESPYPPMTYGVPYPPPGVAARAAALGVVGEQAKRCSTSTLPRDSTV